MDSIRPFKKVRSLFSGHFYRIISPEHKDFVISPCAVLKFLVAVSLGASQSLSDEILWDLYVKHVDEDILMELARQEGIFDMGFTLEISEKLELELSDYINRDTLLDFFKNDFTELSDFVTIQNFIIADERLQFREDYCDFMEKYFNTTLIHRNTPEKLQLVCQNYLDFPSKKSLDIFGAVNFRLNFDEPFIMLRDGSFEAFGSFKYSEITNENSIYFRTKVLEVPLKSSPDVSLTMIIFLPNDFHTLLKQSIGRDYMDFNKIVGRLEERKVEVKLPKIKIEVTTDLTNFFGENTRRGLRKLFNKPVHLEGMFENATDTEQYFGNYWQNTTLEITAPKEVVTGKESSFQTPEVVFDARQKSILYVIKTNEVIYAIGHYSKGN